MKNKVESLELIFFEPHAITFNHHQVRVVDTRIWFEKKGPRGQNLSRESRNIQQDRLTKVAINQVR